MVPPADAGSGFAFTQVHRPVHHCTSLRISVAAADRSIRPVGAPAEAFCAHVTRFQGKDGWAFSINAFMAAILRARTVVEAAVKGKGITKGTLSMISPRRHSSARGHEGPGSWDSSFWKRHGAWRYR